MTTAIIPEPHPSDMNKFPFLHGTPIQGGESKKKAQKQKQQQRKSQKKQQKQQKSQKRQQKSRKTQRRK